MDCAYTGTEKDAEAAAATAPPRRLLNCMKYLPAPAMAGASARMNART
jgi:hypothetical protein